MTIILTSRKLVEVVGFEPTAFLMWRIYSPLPSTNSAHTSKNLVLGGGIEPLLPAVKGQCPNR